MGCGSCGHKYIRPVNQLEDSENPVTRNNLPVSTKGRFRLHKSSPRTIKQEDLSTEEELKSSTS